MVRLVRSSWLLFALALCCVAPASGDSGFSIPGIDVSPTKVHFGSVETRTCDVLHTTNCTIRTVTLTNTSNTGFFFSGAGISSPPVGLGVGFGNNGTCFYLPDHILQPGQTCTVLLSCCGGGEEGLVKGPLDLYGYFIDTQDQGVPAIEVPVYVRLIS
jgi:hypothetical protein